MKFTATLQKIGIPTGSEPMILDSSLACTANGGLARARKEGKHLSYDWSLDAYGNLTGNRE